MDQPYLRETLIQLREALDVPWAAAFDAALWVADLHDEMRAAGVPWQTPQVGVTPRGRVRLEFEWVRVELEPGGDRWLLEDEDGSGWVTTVEGRQALIERLRGGAR